MNILVLLKKANSRIKSVTWLNQISLSEEPGLILFINLILKHFLLNNFLLQGEKPVLRNQLNGKLPVRLTHILHIVFVDPVSAFGAVSIQVGHDFGVI